MESKKSEAQQPDKVVDEQSIHDENLDVDDKSVDDLNNKDMAEKKNEPDNPEEQKEIQVNFGQEDMREIDDVNAEKTDEIINEMNQDDLEDLNGADVSDVEAQTKINEARSRARLTDIGVDNMENANAKEQTQSDDELDL